MRRLTRTAGNDNGSALALVLCLMVIIAVVSITVVTVSVTATAFATSDRADVQSQAAAQAGVDATYAVMNTPGGSSLICSKSSTVTPVYATTVTYKDSSGAALPCTGTTVSGTPATAVITSTGTAATTGLRATDGNTSTVAASATITTTSTTSGSALTDLLYSGAGLTLPNDVTLASSTPGALDASVYSSGAISCNTQSAIQGNVITQGTVSIPNSCPVAGYVWAGGAVNLSSQANVSGDIYSAGPVALTTGHVGGAVIAQGDVTMDSSGAKSCSGTSSSNVCGSIVSLSGSVTPSNNNIAVGGSVYAANAVGLGSAVNGAVTVAKDVVAAGGNVTASNVSGRTVGGTLKAKGTVSGLSTSNVGSSASSCQFGATSPFSRCSVAPTIPSVLNPVDTFPSGLGFPGTSTVSAPPTHTMPAIGNGATDLAKWTAAGWTVVNVSTCALAKTDIDVLAATQFLAPGKFVFNVTNCSSPLTWDGLSLTAYSDIAVINPGGFAFVNGAGVKSFTSTKRQVSLIVPTGSTAGISTNGSTFSNVSTLLYTPGTVSMSNGMTGFVGQIYGGTVTGPTAASTLTMQSITVPGATGGSGGTTTSTTTVALTSRTDVAG